MARMRKCPWCKMMSEEGPEACPYCHKKLIALADGSLTAEGMKPCPFCGKPNKSDASRCFDCGKIVDGSDITLVKTPLGQKAKNLLWKIYIVLAVLIIPSVFVEFGWFLAIFCVAIIISTHMRTIQTSKDLKEASDSIFMISLAFIFFGGALTIGLGWNFWDALKAKVDHAASGQLLIMSGSIFLSGLAGVLWGARQGIPNIWESIKDLYKD